ncbi:hypothetical protein [Shinella sp. BYT-45]|uniref:hypothetical protein n=1 Tax=Shinella sp. BYT-45 TaxID=3377377 RepID=UPI00397FB89A
MRTLPHALLATPDGLALPAGAETDGRFAIVEAAASVESLRHSLAGGAAGIALAGCRDGAAVQRLAVLLSVAEAEEGRPEGSTPILAVTDGILPAPSSPRNLSGKSGRLAGLVWDERALAGALNARRSRAGNGEWTGAFAAARAAVLLTAAAAGIPAYDSVSELDGEAFAADCRRSRDDGFFGRVAGDEAQLAAIEAAYGQARG